MWIACCVGPVALGGRRPCALGRHRGTNTHYLILPDRSNFKWSSSGYDKSRKNEHVFIHFPYLPGIPKMCYMTVVFMFCKIP